MSLIINTSAIKIIIQTERGLNPCRLELPHAKWVVADTDYFYSVGRPQSVTCSDSTDADGYTIHRFTGECASNLRVCHCFRYHPDAAFVDEWIEFTNTGKSAVDLTTATSPGREALRCGFAKQVHTPLDPTPTDVSWSPLPFVRATEDGALRRFSVERFAKPDSEACAAEGWVLSREGHHLLIIKYNPSALELSVVGPAPNAAAPNAASPGLMIFGGTSVYRGDPEAAQHLAPGQTLRMGTTRYQYVSGSFENALYAFRGFMDVRGHRFAPDYDPPVHWNVIYDNPTWWNPPDNEATRAKHYLSRHLHDEAVKAREIGCEAIYLDPGWDTHFGSSIWDAERLGPLNSFVRTMRDDYGLAVALHTPLANWNIYKSYPAPALLRDEDNNLKSLSEWEGFDHGLCSAAPGWWDTKRDRLLALAQAGVGFVMFDGTNYTPCYDANHGHSIPLTREEHIQSYAELARTLRKQYPALRIEMHDQVVGPVEQRYVPMYYTQAADTFECIWGFEYMWYSMQDLLNGKAMALYYYNLAYSIPLYLHVNLKTDNHHALMFWWYASTCRHLGIGGRDAVLPACKDLPEIGIGNGFEPDLVRWDAHRHAMLTYRRLKSFYTRGEFFGINETTHIHALPRQDAAVVNCFNLSDNPEQREVDIDLRSMLLDPAHSYHVVGASRYEQIEGRLILTVDLPAHGVAIIEIKPEA